MTPTQQSAHMINHGMVTDGDHPDLADRRLTEPAPGRPELIITAVEAFPLTLTGDGRPDPEGARYHVGQNRPTIYPTGRETLFVRIETSPATSAGARRWLRPRRGCRRRSSPTC